MQQVLTATHTGYYYVGSTMQDLVGEQYSYPIEPGTLLAGNTDDMILKASSAAKFNPPLLPQEAVLINQTGSMRLSS